LHCDWRNRALKARSPFPRLGWLWFTLPFLLAFVPLVLGTIFRSPTPPPESIPAPQWAFYTVDAMLVLQLLVSILAIRGSAAYPAPAVRSAAGWQVFAVGVVLLQWLLLLGASFTAGMAMTGDWP
jgi:hypothetical protein